MRKLPELLNGLLDLTGELIEHLQASLLVVNDDVLARRRFTASATRCC